MSNEAQKLKDEDTVELQNGTPLTDTYRYFLYYEIIAILVFLPLMFGQVYLTMDYFLYIYEEVDNYHYYFVINRLSPNAYTADFVPAPKFDGFYNSTYLSNCDQGYSFDRLLVLDEIRNTEPIEITDSINITDPDFPNITLDTNARHYKFYSYDISTPPTNKSNAKTIYLNTPINFNFWKGKRYCRKKIFMDVNNNLLQVIDGDKSCSQELSAYHADDCGSYFNNSYRICAIREYAYDLFMNSYNDDEKLLLSKDNICPVTKMDSQIEKDGSSLIVPIMKNDPIPSTGKKEDLFFMVIFDWIKFSGYLSNLPGNYSMKNYLAGAISVDVNQTFGIMDDMNIRLDDDDFMNFYTYSTDLLMYYRGYLNDTSGYFYKPFVSKPTRIILALSVYRTFSPHCYTNVYRARGEMRLLSLAADLDVSDLFGFVLTITVWTAASIFLGFYSGLNLRLKIIIQKLKGTINLNNKKSEEIMKFTNKLFWFLVFIIKFGVLIQMFVLTLSQLSIVDDFIKFTCYMEETIIILKVFQVFLVTCKEKCINILAFLLIEFAMESLIIVGYVFIHIQIKRREMLNDKILSVMERSKDD